jgi:acylpyruvate hydrolase
VKLATIRTAQGTRAVRREADHYVELPAGDIGQLLARPGWEARAAAAGPEHPLAAADLAPPVARPGKIICVGLNYRQHIVEMGRELPRFPTLFAKFAEALVGANDNIVLPELSGQVDWEAELAFVIGRRVRHADEETASAAIAGFTVLNDVTMRDWQYRTPQWLQGKTFEHSTPVGPVIVTPEDLPGGVRPALRVTCAVDGDPVQESSTGDLVFDPVQLVTYISAIVTLNPGDLIAMGTPGGVGHARKPPRYLTAGSRLSTEVDGIGRLDNIVAAEVPAGDLSSV